MLAFDFSPAAVNPLTAWLAKKVRAVKLTLVNGETLLVVHGSPCAARNLEIIGEHRRLFVEADWIICCHGAYMPPWVQKKIPKELVTEKELQLYRYALTSVTVKVCD